MSFDYAFSKTLPREEFKEWEEHFKKKKIPYEVREVEKTTRGDFAIFLDYAPLTLEELRKDGWNVKEKKR